MVQVGVKTSMSVAGMICAAIRLHEKRLNVIESGVET